MPRKKKAPPQAKAAGQDNKNSGVEEGYLSAIHKATKDLQPNPIETVDFLEKIKSGGPHCLTAIPSNRENPPESWPRNKKGEPYATLTRTFTKRSDIMEWVLYGADYKLNLSYTPNPLLHSVRSKPKKTDIKEGAWLYCDIDPRVGEDLEEEQKRIKNEIANFEPKPTIVVFSGGGYQVLWRIKDPFPINGNIAKAEEYERYNHALQSQFLGGDNTHNADRLLRLPGSINWPDERKLKKGRKPGGAYVC